MQLQLLCTRARQASGPCRDRLCIFVCCAQTGRPSARDGGGGLAVIDLGGVAVDPLRDVTQGRW